MTVDEAIAFLRKGRAKCRCDICRAEKIVVAEVERLRAIVAELTKEKSNEKDE